VPLAAGSVEGDEVAARSQGGEVGPDHGGRLVVVDDVAQDAGHDQRHGPVQVHCAGGLGQHLRGLPGIGVEVPRGALRGARQQRPGVLLHQRVDVDVDDPGLRRQPLRHLVDVVGGRQTGADVEELPDPGLGGDVADRAHQEGPRRAGVLDDLRERLPDLVAHLPVDGEVLRPAQPVVPDPRGLRRTRFIGHRQ
jgi:hypothetical protein